nr:zinc finger, CCHC-type [Tanacetum cinerariifolium]
MEVKFLALAAAGKEAEWLRNMVSFYTLNEVYLWKLKGFTYVDISSGAAPTKETLLEDLETDVSESELETKTEPDSESEKGDTNVELAEDRTQTQFDYVEAPDIAYAVCKLSRYTSNPSQDQWKAIGRVFGYLKRTRQLALYYNRFPVVLEGYSDASWITESSDSKSTTGWIFTLGGGAICWGSKKQTCITHSTMEAEFLALATAGKEAEWLRNMLLDIELWPQLMLAISLHCDSQSTLLRAYNKVYNGSLDTLALDMPISRS